MLQLGIGLGLGSDKMVRVLNSHLGPAGERVQKVT